MPTVESKETKQNSKSLIVSLVCILMMGVLTGAFFGHKSYDVSSGSHSFFFVFFMVNTIQWPLSNRDGHCRTRETKQGPSRKYLRIFLRILLILIIIVGVFMGAFFGLKAMGTEDKAAILIIVAVIAAILFLFVHCCSKVFILPHIKRYADRCRAHVE